MAGGKLTPRQKMINLMYLVFIAMLALNMSKEVLSAFGLMNEKFESSNSKSEVSNKDLLATLNLKGTENAGEFGEAKNVSNKVSVITKTFYDYIASLKKEVTVGVELENGKLPYETMDKGQTIDEGWFSGDAYSTKGNQIISTIEKYKSDMKAAIGNQPKLKATLSEINTKFDLSDIKDREGVSKKYLSYNFEHFPLIASLAKLTAYQNDVKKSEGDIFNILLGKAASEAASYSKFQAIVVLDKSAYFQGEKVTGKVVLGKYDENTKPTSFQGPGKIENGQAVISMTAGGVGEQKINGQFTFLEDGKTVPLKFEGNYVVVPRPNSANISADKMNVVYRGLPNPMTISFAGIGDNLVNASAPGLSKSGKAGQYNLNPSSGTEVTVSVSGKLPDGSTVSDKKMFRIKGLPSPVGCIAGEEGGSKGAKTRLGVSQITAKLKDFVYDLNYVVTGFSFKAPGQGTVIVQGDRVNAQCNAAMARLTRGDQVTIFDIKTKIVGVGAGVTPGKCSPVIYDIQ
jgi:gliding motility-associated protein GldM